MFEKYTEKARRVLFFARYEASAYGSPYIEPDFLMLGVLREDKNIAARWVGGQGEQIRDTIASAYSVLSKSTASSLDLPLSDGAKQVLALAAEEAEILEHKHIGPEHLFLALLRQRRLLTAKIFEELGVTADKVRAAIAKGEDAPPLIPATARARRITVQLEDGTEIATMNWSDRIQAIGESIMIEDGFGAAQVFRVVDVRWHLRIAPSNPGEHAASIVFPIMLTVRRDDA
jgi:ATP-dependent Clp protease ATP-binding subunit ClpA